MKGGYSAPTGQKGYTTPTGQKGYTATAPMGATTRPMTPPTTGSRTVYRKTGRGGGR